MKNLRGFTLIELMITITVVAILLSLAIPSFDNIIRENRMTTQTNELITAISIARSEAIRQGVQVDVVPVSGSWNNGWIVKVNGGADLRVFEAPGGTITITSTLASLQYSASGLPTESSLLTTAASAENSFSVCDSGKSGRKIRLVSGRPRIDNKTPC